MNLPDWNSNGFHPYTYWMAALGAAAGLLLMDKEQKKIHVYSITRALDLEVRLSQSWCHDLVKPEG